MDRLTRTKFLASVAVLAALGQRQQLSRVLDKARRLKVPPSKIIETLLQVHLFAGFPASIEGLAMFRSVYANMNDPPSRPMSLQSRRKFGVAACRRVYGSRLDSLMVSMEKLHPDLATWMIEDGYGKVLSRRGLTLHERELISVTILAALGWDRQLHSHVIGSQNVGSNRGEIIAVMRVVRGFLPARRYSRGMMVVRKALRQKSA